MMTRYFLEDLQVGKILNPGSYTVTKTGIIEFAREFDPKSFHLAETAGKASNLGSLAASGWHTAAITMRLLTLGFLNDSSCQGSPGVEKLV